jgi:hypothetical protein
MKRKALPIRLAKRMEREENKFKKKLDWMILRF